jgi:hypothetical protein
MKLIAATLAIALGQTAAAGPASSAASLAEVQIVSTDTDHVVGVVGDSVVEGREEDAVRRARIVTYSPRQDDVAGGDGRPLGKANVAVFHLMVDCDGARIRAFAADYFQWPSPARAYHVDYDKALFIPAREDQTLAIVAKVCAGPAQRSKGPQAGPDLAAFVAEAKTRF